jgi:hypothetical protein
MGENQLGCSVRKLTPAQKENYDEWFAYLHECKAARIKYGLEDLANDIGLTYGYARQLHRLYLAEHENEQNA